jgi:hypothetical protein
MEVDLSGKYGQLFQKNPELTVAAGMLAWRLGALTVIFVASRSVPAVAAAWTPGRGREPPWKATTRREPSPE